MGADELILLDSILEIFLGLETLRDLNSLFPTLKALSE